MMFYFLYILAVMSYETDIMLFDFSAETKSTSWQIVNDGVMGGLSNSSLKVNTDGHGVFSGHVSLANNGGFASVRHTGKFEKIDSFKFVILRIKGDGKNYQFRLKSNRNQRQSYVQEFSTTGEWQEIKLRLDLFSPQFRGRKLDMPNFNFDEIAEMAFLIGNKKEEDFKLIIDHILLVE